MTLFSWWKWYAHSAISQADGRTARHSTAKRISLLLPVPIYSDRLLTFSERFPNMTRRLILASGSFCFDGSGIGASSGRGQDQGLAAKQPESI